MVVDLEKGTEDAKSAPADAQLLAMAAAGGEKKVLIPDLRCPPPEKHMPDLEERIDQESMDTVREHGLVVLLTDTPARQVQAVAEGEEHLILKDLRHHQVEGGAVADNMDPVQKKWLAYWLLVAAASVIILNNHIYAAQKYQLFPPEIAMFIVFLCAACLMLHSMKQMM
ncbi:unnamed protein product [Urochloa humidicola]